MFARSFFVLAVIWIFGRKVETVSQLHTYNSAVGSPDHTRAINQPKNQFNRKV